MIEAVRNVDQYGLGLGHKHAQSPELGACQDMVVTDSFVAHSLHRSQLWQYEEREMLSIQDEGVQDGTHQGGGVEVGQDGEAGAVAGDAQMGVSERCPTGGARRC
jgi:hypothetical protein